jgi:hypothetical protein
VASGKIFTVAVKIKHYFVAELAALKVQAGNRWLLPLFVLVIPESRGAASLHTEPIVDFIENANCLDLMAAFELFIVFLLIEVI